MARLEKSALSCTSPHQNPSKIDSPRGASSFERANGSEKQGKKAKQYKILQVFLTQFIQAFASQNLIGSSPVWLSIPQRTKKGKSKLRNSRSLTTAPPTASNYVLAHHLQTLYHIIANLSSLFSSRRKKIIFANFADENTKKFLHTTLKDREPSPVTKERERGWGRESKSKTFFSSRPVTSRPVSSPSLPPPIVLPLLLPFSSQTPKQKAPRAIRWITQGCHAIYPISVSFPKRIIRGVSSSGRWRSLTPPFL